MSRQEILERERRWRKPVALIGAVGLVLLLGGGILAPTSGETAAEGARSTSEDPTAVILTSIATGIGLAAILAPLLYVFNAARARSEAVQGLMLGFVFLGPILFGVSSIVLGFSSVQVADDFVAAEAAAPDVTEEALLASLKKDPGAFEEVTLYTESDDPVLDVETSEGKFYTVEFDESKQEELTDQLQKAEDDPKSTFTFSEEDLGDAGDAQLGDLQEDSSLRNALLYFGLAGTLSFVVALFYTSLHAMRTGLFTRFYGTMCMALAVAMVLIQPLLTVALLVFLGGVVLLTLGRFPGGTPPAWEAGEAMPWPKPGEEEAQGAAEVLEGDASEVDEDEDGEPTPHAARRQRAKRKKRKRR
jgi:hypothetical protein